MRQHLVAIRLLFLKDLRLLWPLVLPTLASFLLWALLPRELNEVRKLAGTLSTAASALLIVAAIHLDAPASLRLDWLTRPIPRGALLAEKILFLLVTILAPSYLSDVTPRLIAGIPSGQALSMAGSEHLVGLAAALPLMAIAALTTTLIEAGVLGLVIGALAVVMPPLAIMMAGLRPESVSGETGWMLVRTLAFIAMGGGALVLWLQYVPRRTRAARFAFAATVLLVMVAQLVLAFSLSAPSH